MNLVGPFSGVKINSDLRFLFLCVLIVMMASFAVIYCAHKVRYLHSTLETLHAKEAALQLEYKMLLLESSTWTTNFRVEQVAKDLGMVMPNKVIMIKP